MFPYRHIHQISSTSFSWISSWDQMSCRWWWQSSSCSGDPQWAGGTTNEKLVPRRRSSPQQEVRWDEVHSQDEKLSGEAADRCVITVGHKVDTPPLHCLYCIRACMDACRRHPPASLHHSAGNTSFFTCSDFILKISDIDIENINIIFPIKLFLNVTLIIPSLWLSKPLFFPQETNSRFIVVINSQKLQLLFSKYHNKLSQLYYHTVHSLCPPPTKSYYFHYCRHSEHVSFPNSLQLFLWKSQTLFVFPAPGLIFFLNVHQISPSPTQFHTCWNPDLQMLGFSWTNSLSGGPGSDPVTVLNLLDHVFVF